MSGSLNITTDMDRFAEQPPPAYTRKVGLTESEVDDGPKMTLAEYKAAKAEEEKVRAQEALDEIKRNQADIPEPPFSIPRCPRDSLATRAARRDAPKVLVMARLPHAEPRRASSSC